MWDKVVLLPLGCPAVSTGHSSVLLKIFQNAKGGPNYWVVLVAPVLQSSCCCSGTGTVGGRAPKIKGALLLASRPRIPTCPFACLENNHFCCSQIHQPPFSGIFKLVFWMLHNQFLTLTYQRFKWTRNQAAFRGYMKGYIHKEFLLSSKVHK